MWSEDDKLYYQSLIETATEEDKYDKAPGSLIVLCSLESDSL